MNKNIIIAILIVIIIAIVGAFVLTQGSGEKIDTRINYLNENATFKNGEQVEFELRDINGNVLEGEQLNITYAGDENQTYTVVTDSNGKCSLIIENQPAGDYVVVVKYGGSDKYNEYELQKTITVVEGTSDSASTDSTSSDSASTTSTASSAQSSNQTSSSGSGSSSNSNLHYDSEYNFYYDDNGIVRGGQSDGMSAKELRENYESGDSIDENGNLQ